MMRLSDSQWEQSTSSQFANSIQSGGTSTLHLHSQDPLQTPSQLTLTAEAMADLLSGRTGPLSEWKAANATGTKSSFLRRISGSLNKVLIALLALAWSSGILLAAALIGMGRLF